MAKPSARGRFELARVEVTRKGDGTLYVSERVVRAVMSDGVVLEKRVTTFSDTHTHDYGWKVWGKCKDKKTFDARKWVEFYVGKGWKDVSKS